MSLNFGQYTAVQKCLMGVVSSLLMFMLTNVNAQDVRSTEKNGAIYSIQVLGASYSDKSGAVATDQSRILFYRSGTSRQGDAGSVFVNGMYHASLVAGAYSPICLRPGIVQVGVREMQVAAGPRDGYDSISMVDAKPGNTTYVRISEDGTRAQVVPEKIAESELVNSKLQIHTISRVEGAEPCRPSGKARVQIAGDALFKFNRSDLNGLTGRGVKALDEIAQRLKQDYTRIDVLVFAGYTDPLGIMPKTSSSRGHAPKPFDIIWRNRAFNRLIARSMDGDRPNSWSQTVHVKKQRPLLPAINPIAVSWLRLMACADSKSIVTKNN